MTKNFIKPEIAIEMFDKENVLTESAVALQTTINTLDGNVPVSKVASEDFSVFETQN